MPSLSFATVDVFTTTRFAGNPLAIVRIPQGQDVPTEQLQRIADEFNLSETVFLYESAADSREWRVRIFMVSFELPFAGHPTIGTACYALGTLADNAASGKFLCKAGPIGLDYSAGVAKASIPHNVHIHTEHKFTLEQLYTFQPALKATKPPHAMNIISPVRGMNFLCVELASLEDLALVKVTGIRPSAQLDTDWDVGFTASYFYVVMHQPGDRRPERLDVRTRMIEGTMEDPATGSAACGLCALLATDGKHPDLAVSIVQGVEMGRRSEIGVDVRLMGPDWEAVETIHLSGSAVKVMEGTVEYD
ncbi:hypothetical protein LTR53_010119 [Teratosphaeriaceae sp. CCFEE 6253]|nr:hypothetical protein LTR53_010119 [Teratosphaeriaceae sp. CCFEE 6253]